MTTIAVFGRFQDADLARTRLESAGIPTFYPDESTMSWMVEGALPLAQGVRLQVEEADVARALEVLAEPPERGAPLAG